RWRSWTRNRVGISRTPRRLTSSASALASILRTETRSRRRVCRLATTDSMRRAGPEVRLVTNTRRVRRREDPRIRSPFLITADSKPGASARGRSGAARQGDPDVGAPAVAGADLGGAAVGRGDRADDGEAKPGAAAAACLVGAREALEGALGEAV